MWGKGNPIAVKWGSTKTEDLTDGLGQGNNIAHFPNPTAGACAQFDLWNQHYCNMSLHNAILKWSGGNWSQEYANFLTQHTGLTLGSTVTSRMLAGPQGLALMKYQAQWEAGKPYPLTDAEWAQAQGMVFTVTTSEPGAQSNPPGQAAPPTVVEFTIPPGVTIKVNGKVIS